MWSAYSMKELDHMVPFLIPVMLIPFDRIALIILIEPLKTVVDRFDGAPFWFHEYFDFVEEEKLDSSILICKVDFWINLSNFTVNSTFFNSKSLKSSVMGPGDHLL